MSASARTTGRKLHISAVLTLTAVLAITLAAPPAFAGYPVFQRTKPHVNVGAKAPMGFVSPRPPQPPVQLGFRPTMVFNQPRSPAASGVEYKYVPVRRTASGVAIEQLELVHEGFVRPTQGGAPRFRFGDGRHGASGSVSPGGHVKVFSGGTW